MGLKLLEGGHPELSSVFKFGKNNAVGTSYETIWDEGGLYQCITTPSVLKVASTNANDTSAGTGARTIRVYGLDTAGLEIEETITLNGQTAVNTTLTYSYVYRALVLTAGSGASAAGVIRVGAGTVTSGVPQYVYANINDGDNYQKFTAPHQLNFGGGSFRASGVQSLVGYKF